MGVDAPLLPAPPPIDRRPWLGYVMAMSAAVLWAVNGTVVKVIQESAGMSSLRLVEIRSMGAFVALAAAIVIVRPSLLRVSLRELPYLVVFGVAGLALVQWLYLVAIHRLPIGIALIIEYVGIVFVALWARFVYGEPVRRRVWAAIVLAIAGLALVVELWAGLVLDGWGLAAAVAAAIALAAYLLMAEHEVGKRDPMSLVCYGFLFAALFWSVVQPWWSFPIGLLDDQVTMLGNFEGTTAPVWMLLLYMIVLGTVAPFLLVVGALRHVVATRVGIVSMLEPVAASIVAFAWLGESLGAPQLVGGGIVLAGIALAQTAR